jgi:hypothetical protein
MTSVFFDVTYQVKDKEGKYDWHGIFPYPSTDAEALPALTMLME